MPDVWMAYGRDPEERLDLLLAPHRRAKRRRARAGARARARDREPAVEMELAYNQAYVAARLTFEEMVTGSAPALAVVARVPVAGGRRPTWPPCSKSVATRSSRGLKNPMREQGKRAVGDELPGALVWFVGLVGRIEWERHRKPGDGGLRRGRATAGPDLRAARRRGARPARRPGARATDSPPLLWSINRNRPARAAVWRSRVTVKADAATRLFRLSCRTLCWAVLDSGVDATHPAFARRDDDGALAKSADGHQPASGSRVRATYDFTLLRGAARGHAGEGLAR